MKKIFTLFLTLSVGIAFSQSQIDSASKSLKVYLNCSDYCYQDYLKSQTTWVYFVRDQFVADVNLRINTLTTGSGGEAFHLIFEGLHEMKHLRDTVNFNTNAINTSNETRAVLLKHVQLGLVRYAMQSEKHVNLHVTSADSLDNIELGQGSNPEEDPFNAWVFNISLQGYSSGQKISRYMSTSGTISASQIKETHKVRFFTSYDQNINRYNYNNEISIYRQENFSSNLLYAKSINEHWSAGTFQQYSQSTYNNYLHSINSYAALEYNFFPYQESQTKQFTLSSYLGSLYNVYHDTTIYLRTKEWRPTAQLNAMCSFNQSWGSIYCGITNNILLNDLKKNNTSISASIDARIYKGLSISLSGQFSFIRNQINLPKEGASIDMVLLQQQVLATSFSYYYFGSINYRFGSIFNNVVNTRFSNEF